MKEKGICYFCGKTAVSKEHVPPRSLYPNDDKFRYSLKKVPSCDEHNGKKSSLDNRMFTFLVGTSNNVNKKRELRALRDKTIRAMMRDITLFNKITCDARVVKRKVGGLDLLTPSMENIGALVDYNDHKNYQESILRGLYYHTYNIPFSKEIYIIPRAFIGFNADFDNIKSILGIDEFEDKVKNNKCEMSGDYIFQHSVISEGDLVIIHACIYQEYFFHGIFCDKDLHSKILNLFGDNCPTKKFNGFQPSS